MTNKVHTLQKAEIDRDFTMLIDGKNAFPEILRCIAAARRSIYINMFIWRDDAIGNAIAQAVLEAAQRGVQVELSVDRYGVVLEKAEESKRSFFHKRQSLAERVKITALELLYPMENAPRKARDRETELYRAIMSHPNIRVERNEFKADHSKYYIFDGEVLILGGINIEDKENGQDLQGRTYQDYMVKLTGRQYVDALVTKLQRTEVHSSGYFFGVNVKKPERYFEMETLYLSMIENARQELTVTMAYFSPLPRFVDALVAAHRRGVRVTVLVPQRANYQSDSNLKAVHQLLRKSDGGIAVYLSPKMVHTKLLVNDGYITFGSCNITKKAFRQLSELNLFVRRRDSDFERALLASVAENQALSHRVSDYREITYHRLLAWLEGFLV